MNKYCNKCKQLRVRGRFSDKFCVDCGASANWTKAISKEVPA